MFCIPNTFCAYLIASSNVFAGSKLSFSGRLLRINFSSYNEEIFLCANLTPIKANSPPAAIVDKMPMQHFVTLSIFFYFHCCYCF